MRQLLLVRHGQASFGARDYDALSDRGHEQSRILGRALALRGVAPAVVVRGQLSRHEETTASLLEGLGAATPVMVDSAWDEFDFQHVIEVHKPRYRSRTFMVADLARTTRPRQAFQRIFEEATARWTSGAHDEDYRESFPAFSARVVDALRRTAALEPDRGTALVITSGGPIAVAASHLLTGDASLWAAHNRVAVNTAVTKVLNGGRGLHLSVFNSHEHLEHDATLLTYR